LSSAGRDAQTLSTRDFSTSAAAFFPAKNQAFLVAYGLLVHLGMRKVLILDGPLSARGDLPKRLVDLGFEIVRAAPGKTLAERVQHAAPDIVLMNGGAEGLASAAEIFRMSLCPVVLLANGDANGATAPAYLLKPLGGNELLPAIEVAVSGLAELSALKKENEELKKTLEARKMIERAKGVLMKNRGLTEAEAFALIQRKSMDMRRPMVDIAQAIVLSEEITKEKAG
jgi:two-component system, response regulator PdtaR